MHTIREITRLATMLAGLIAPRLRLDYALATISCEHCRSSRNNALCATRHVIYYSLPEKNLFKWRSHDMENVRIAKVDYEVNTYTIG